MKQSTLQASRCSEAVGLAPQLTFAWALSWDGPKAGFRHMMGSAPEIFVKPSDMHSRATYTVSLTVTGFAASPPINITRVFTISASSLVASLGDSAGRSAYRKGLVRFDASLSRDPDDCDASTKSFAVQIPRGCAGETQLTFKWYCMADSQPCREASGRVATILQAGALLELSMAALQLQGVEKVTVSVVVSGGGRSAKATEVVDLTDDPGQGNVTIQAQIMGPSWVSVRGSVEGTWSLQGPSPLPRIPQSAAPAGFNGRDFVLDLGLLRLVPGDSSAAFSVVLFSPVTLTLCKCRISWIPAFSQQDMVRGFWSSDSLMQVPQKV
jgi:hypothetical protein